MAIIVIAEAGVNHNGDIALAKQLVEVAAKSGANFVKFQTFRADRLATKSAPKAAYQLKKSVNSESQYEMLKELELSESMHRELIHECRHLGIGFLSTAFDIESADMLLELGQEIFKVPSGEISNLPYLRHLGSFGKQVFLSTGNSTMDEIEKAVDILEASGTKESQITVLHCTSAYPAPIEDVNLLAMKSIKDRIGVKVGYSDHTLGVEIAIAAAALGASVIEKHFTINRNLPGPDHKCSLEPEELELMICQIRNIELALGDGVKRPRKSEIVNRDKVRKSVVAKISIRKGEKFSVDNITTKRPGNGISPMEWDRLIGKAAHRDFMIDEFIDEA
jgi:N,N'-diacetyllegionaminate synthase